MKITRFRDIPDFTRAGSWECNYSLESAVHTIDKWIAEDGLDDDPDFQRAHVWTEAQQIAWLEFFFRGGKTGRVLYFNCPHWSSGRRDVWFVVVDGKQRLQAARRFIRNEIPIFGSYYREFEDHMPWCDKTLRINVNDLKTRAEVLQWYIEFNAGGTPHTEDEIARVRGLLRREAAGRERRTEVAEVKNS